MNSLPGHNPEPENDPRQPEGSGERTEPRDFPDERVSDAAPSEGLLVEASPPSPVFAVTENPFPDTQSVEQRPETPALEPPLFQSFSQPEIRPPARIPHLGHVAILAVFVIFGLLAASILIFSALHFHLFGVSNQQEAVTEIHYTLGSEAVLYLIMFGSCLLFFPLIWHKGFFAGLQWNGATALRLRSRLFMIAAICCGLALVNGLLLPGPKDAPIDKIFHTPGAAWLLFAFGVTFAPFFEEMVFRGFLLPAFCTGADWIAERVSNVSDPVLDAGGRPRWSMQAIGVVVATYASGPIVIMGALRFLPGFVALLVILPYILGLVLFLVVLSTRNRSVNDPGRLVDSNGHPIWSMASMVIASVFVSLPFALMHAAQTGYSWGPFVLLVSVSLVLCWARLSTRSLAASVMVHASYNFLLFSLMLLGTGGFRHLDRM